MQCVAFLGVAEDVPEKDCICEGLDLGLVVTSISIKTAR